MYSLGRINRPLHVCAFLAAFGLICAALVGPADAGSNAGGTLIFHVNEAIVYCSDEFELCPFLEGDGSRLTDCESAITNIPFTDTTVFSVYAAFPEKSSPRVAAVAFGLNFNTAEFFFVTAQSCADFEQTTGDWPYSSDSGTVVSWNPARTDPLLLVYAFAGYNYYGYDNTVELMPHPTEGAVFADDSVPAVVDPIAGLGVLGFGNEPGEAPCPTAGPVGYCCVCGECFNLTEEECLDLEGYWDLGSCDDPWACEGNPLGACCFNGECDDCVTASECSDLGGEYLGDHVPCEPGICDVVPTNEVSWGLLKKEYREH